MAFSLIRGLHNIHPVGRGCVATIGSFDGVHKGHQVILDQVKEKADRLGLSSVVIVFEPQPDEYFSGEQAPARLMLLRDKLVALRDAGIDQVVCLRFNDYLRDLSAEAFVENILLDGLAAKHLVIGDDFRFGQGRQGNFELLQSMGSTHGFELEQTLTVEQGGERISSTRIRGLLETENFALAEELLGKPYSITGKVVYGQQLGRTLGFPTANVRLRRYRSPLNGVFAVEAEIHDGSRVHGVANIGVRPTVAGLVKPILEVYLLDYAEDVYGSTIRIVPRNKLRDEKKFDSLDDLKKAIELDVKAARQFFEI